MTMRPPLPPAVRLWPMALVLTAIFAIGSYLYCTRSM